MNKTCIIHLPPGCVADPKFLKDAVVRFPTVFGFALQHEGQLVSEVHPKAWTVENIQAITDGTKDGHRVLVLGNWPKFVKEDIMPIVLTDKDNEPFLAIAYEGDFSSFAGMNGDHTEESNVFDEVVALRIDKAVKDSGGDMDKLIELIGQDAFQRTLMKAYDNRGEYFFLGKEGAPIIFGENNLGKKFSWGYVSNTAEFAYVEKTAEPPKKEEVAKPVSFLDKVLGRKQEDPAPSGGPVAKPAPTGAILKAAGTETTVTLVEVKVPPQLEKSQKNFWLRTFNGKNPGQLPDDHQSKTVSVWVPPSLVDFAKRPVKSTKDMRDLVAEMKEARSSGKLVDFPSATATEPAPKSTKDTGKSTTREPSSNYVNTSTVLDTKDKERHLNLLAGFLAEKKMTPIEIQKLEAKWPQYSDEVGAQFNDLLFLTPDQVMKLFDGNKPATAAWLQMRRRYIEGSNLKLEDLVTGTEGDEPKVDNQVEVPSEKPAATAAKSGGGNLSFLRRSAA